MTIKEVIDPLSVSLTSSVASSNCLPSDLSYYCAGYPEVKKVRDRVSASILSSINTILRYSTNGEIATFNNLDDFNGRFSEIVDVIDDLLEKVDIELDSLAKKNTIAESVVRGPPINKQRQMNSIAIRKPQESFTEKPDNSYSSFIPKLKVKPNALKPLSLEMQSIKDKYGVEFSGVPHPYQFEIEQLQLPSILTISTEDEIEIFKSVSETTLTYADKYEDLVIISGKLNNVDIFAVDLEHHSYRSFLGLTCLMQISTEEEDFIIDTLALRDHMYILNSSFTNPNIIKVFHGAEFDIVWLQKDFGLYVVNLFDTFHASRVLELGRNSLQYLIKYYTQIDVDKKYQTADWRIRPLDEEMLLYARQDTHYLIYIFKRMINDIIKYVPKTQSLKAVLTQRDKSEVGMTPMEIVYERSKETSLNQFKKPTCTDSDFLMFLAKSLPSMDVLPKKSITVLKHLYKWRDQCARKDDESINFIMSNHLLIHFARDLPETTTELLDSNSKIGKTVPLSVKRYADEIIQVIQNAIEEYESSTSSITEEIVSSALNVAQSHIRFETDDTQSISPEIVVPDTAAVYNAPFLENISNSAISTVGQMFNSSDSEEDNIPMNPIHNQKEDVGRGIESSYLEIPSQQIPISNDQRQSAAMFDSDDDDGDEDDSRKKAKMIYALIGATVAKKTPVPSLELEVPDKSASHSFVPVKDRKSDSSQETKSSPFIESVQIFPQQEVEAKPIINEDDSEVFILSELNGDGKKSKKRKQRKEKSTPLKVDESSSTLIEKPLSIEDLQILHNQKKHKKLVQNSTVVFDPYSKLNVDEKFNKKDPRINLRAKSGSKQMTFK